MNPASEYGAKVLKYIGINVHNNSWRNYVFIIINLCILIGLFILSALQQIVNYHGIGNFTKSFDIISGYLMGCTKLFSIQMYIEEINELISYEGFWSMNYCGINLEDKQLKIYNFLIKMFKVISIFDIFCVIIVYFPPLIFFSSNQFPNEIYEFVDIFKSPAYELIYTWQVVSSFILILLTVGYNCLFLSTLAFMYCQIMMLKYIVNKSLMQTIITNKDEEIIFRNIKKVVKLHYRLLKFMKKVQIVFSNAVLSDLMVCFINICMQLYIMAMSGGKGIVIIKCITAAFLYSLTVFLYCLCSTLVIAQFESIYNAIYSSTWYLSPSKSPRIRKSIILMIQMSQQKLQIKAGSFFTLDINTFTSIVRLAYSYYTLLISLS